jgi:hypothetical protein
VSCKVKVLPIFERRPKCDGPIISTVSIAGHDWCQLSPFLIGPCDLYNGMTAKVMENAWQYSKVYAKHAVNVPEMMHPVITDDYWDWAEEGWDNPRAVRYPMGRGAKPLFSLWEDRIYKYVPARKKIYGPLYAEAVQKTKAWRRLKDLYKHSKELILLDYDAYDHRLLGQTLTDVLNNPKRKMGHAFVLMMLLTRDKALKQMELRE